MPSIYCDNTEYAPWNQLDRESNEDVGDEVADPGLPHLHDDVVDVSLLDVLVNEWPGKAVQWYRNPGNRTGDWAKHLAHPVVDNESPNWVEITGDGLQDVVTGNGRPDIVVGNKKGGFVFLQTPAS